MSEKKDKGQVRDAVVNRRARHDYHIEETIEAGLVLTGSEVKSLRAGKGQLKDSYARVKNGEVWLLQSHISEYAPAARFGHDPTRPRKLLLHKREIARLAGKVREKGLTLIPLRIYFKNGRAKVELGLARGKKLYDKRAALRERDAQREIERAMRGGKS
ncbi:MAG: SsrA-binding protein SmpB [Candidatus Binatia bacterium]|nr:SsrA-binding protein SmpB [Candidatus Binatia bacterium]